LELASGQLEPGIADLSQIILVQPANGTAHYQRGTAYERSGQLDKALEDYRHAMRLQPGFAPASAALGRLLKDKNPDEAIDNLTTAIRLEPRSPALRSRATLYLALGRFDEALRDFSQVIAYDGSDSVAYLDRGVANAKLGHLEAAIRDYSRSIELAATAATYADRGEAYLGVKQPDKALVDFNAALQLDAQNLSALLGRAAIAHTQRAYTASLEDYSRVIELDPKNTTAYFKRGNVHFDLHEYTQALEDYSSALKLDPQQSLALYNRALADARLGRLKDSAADRRQALELDPSLASGEILQPGE
jgi:tetratricopeptide (TPR) repeat protein